MFKTSSMVNLEKSFKGYARHSESMSTGGDFKEQNIMDDIGDMEISRSTMTQVYSTCDWIRAIADRIDERTAQVQFFPMPLGAKIGSKEGELNKTVRVHMEKVITLFMKSNSDGENIKELVGKVAKDVSIYDMAGIQIVKAKDSKSDKKVPYELYANVSGEELYVNPESTGTIPDKNAYVQLRGQETIASWDKEQMMAFIRFRRAGYANGKSPIETAIASIMGDLEAMNFNLKFFQNNARPDFAFIFDNLGFGKSDNELTRAKAWFMKNHQGKPNLPLFMGAEKGNVKIHELKYNHRDMQFFEWQMFLLTRVMAVYGMQPTVLGINNVSDAIGKIDAETQSEQFKRNTLIPYVRMITSGLNSKLIWGDSNLNFDDIYVTSTNLDIDDEAKQAAIDEKYLDRAVITINQVRNRLQMPSVAWGNAPFVPLNYAPYDTLIEYQKSKIASNIQRASSSKIDNNVKVEDKDSGKPTPAKKSEKETLAPWTELDSNQIVGMYQALYPSEFDSTVNWPMGKGDKVLTGLEKAEPSEVMKAVREIIRMRESSLSTTYSFGKTGDRVIDTANGMGLDWRQILKTV